MPKEISGVGGKSDTRVRLSLRELDALEHDQPHEVRQLALCSSGRFLDRLTLSGRDAKPDRAVLALRGGLSAFLARRGHVVADSATRRVFCYLGRFDVAQCSHNVEQRATPNSEACSKWPSIG